MKKQGKDYTNEEIIELFSRLDSNGDEKISFEEFQATPAGRGVCIGIGWGK